MFALIAFPFFLLGIPPALQSREGRFCVLAGIGVSVVLMILSPEKLIRHDFYLYAVFPFVALIAALGVSKTLSRFSGITTAMIVGSFVLLLLASAIFSSRTIFYASESEKKMVGMAERVRERTLPEEQLVVGGESPGIFIFYVDRPSWTLTPSAMGKKLNPYLRMIPFTGRNKASLERLEKASQSPVDWLEYLRSQGAAYFAVPEPNEFRAFPEFLRYLDANYRNISDNPQEYLLYGLENPARSHKIS